MARAAVLFLALGAAVALVAPAAGMTTPPPAGAEWTAARLRDHPLVGRLWRPATGAFAEPAAVVVAARDSRFVLLGETHDNPDHHLLQAWVVRRMTAEGRRPALAFEMITGAERAALDSHLARHPRDAAGLGPAVAWEARGWPDWRMYEPVAAAALEGGLPVVAAGLARERVRAVMTEGTSALDPDLVRRLGLDEPLAADERAALARELAEGHCDLIDEATIARMIPAQRARDAVMAARIAEAAARPGIDGAVLVTGFGHARRDRGVPLYLRRLGDGARILAVGLLEVESGKTDPARYLERSGAAAFDLLWFTPRAEREDPCAALERRLERGRGGEGKKKKQDE